MRRKKSEEEFLITDEKPRGEDILTGVVKFHDPRTGTQEILSRANLFDSASSEEFGELLSPSSTPGSPASRRRRRRKKKAQSDIRSTEGDLIDISPQMGKKKSKKKRTKKRERTSKSPSRLPEMRTPRITIEETSSEEEIEDEYLCKVARTALIMPFVYRSIDHEDSSNRTAALVSKRRVTIPVRKGTHISYKEVPLWRPQIRPPKEVGDLNPLFQQIFGMESKSSIFDSSNVKTWSCQRLVLTDEVMEELFQKPLLHVIQEKEDVPYEVIIERVELIIYPLGSSMLVLHINWLPSEETAGDLSIRDMSTLLFIAKYKHMIQEVCHGWSFGADKISLDLLPNEIVRSLGDLIVDARYGDKTTSLGALGNWMVHLPGEDGSNPPTRLDYTRHAFHHTTVVISHEPPLDLLQDYLFHFRHAYGQKNRPPIHSEATLGRVLVWRLNRYIGLAKEGNVSISWKLPNARDSSNFEEAHWHTKFQGIFLLLATHALGEKLVLYELSDVAAVQAETLRFTNEVNLEEMKDWRNKLRHLASLVVRYTLAMSSNDCGGTSEYSDFFTCLRSVFGILSLREELSGELKDILAVVESNYLEEERRQRDTIETRRRNADKRRKAMDVLHNRQKDAFEILVSVLSAFTLPFVVVGGVFGMNMTSLPIEASFWQVMVWTFIASIILLIGLLLLRYFVRKALTSTKEVEEEEVDE